MNPIVVVFVALTAFAFPGCGAAAIAEQRSTTISDLACAGTGYFGNGAIVDATYSKSLNAAGELITSCSILERGMRSGQELPVRESFPYGDGTCKILYDIDPVNGETGGAFVFDLIPGDPYNRGLIKYVDLYSAYDSVTFWMNCTGQP